MADLRKLIEEAIAEEGGEVARKVVMYHLEHTLKVNPNEALEKPQEFVNALKSIYGDFESIIEGAICEKIAKEYGVEYKGQGLVKLAKELVQ